MTVYFRKRSQPKKAWGEKAAKEQETNMKACPSCGEWAKPYEVHPDRITYKCTRCGALNTFTNRPGTENEPEKKVKKLGAITLRDKSKKKTEKKEEKSEEVRKPEPDEDESAFVRNVNTIKESMQNLKLVGFEYVDRKGVVSQRSVEPYKLTVDKAGGVVLYAFCRERNGIRVFKVKNTAGCKALENSYEPRNDWKVEDKLV